MTDNILTHEAVREIAARAEALVRDNWQFNMSETLRLNRLCRVARTDIPVLCATVEALLAALEAEREASAGLREAGNHLRERDALMAALHQTQESLKATALAAEAERDRLRDALDHIRSVIDTMGDEVLALKARLS